MTDDLNKLSKEELESLLAEETELVNRFYNYEQSVKRILNSIYGAFGNKWFYFFNIDIAESITKQGQDAILYAERMINKYINDFWYNDKKTHEKMGIKVTNPAVKPGVVYIDTDSCYVTFEELIDNSDWKGTEKEFVMSLYDARLKEYLEKIHTIYTKNLNGDDLLVFEMESIAKTGIWLAKKKYLQDIVWEDPNVHHDSLSKIKVKGWETIQSSTPLFARIHLDEILKIIFSQDTPNVKPIVQYLAKIKKIYKDEPIDNISQSLRCNKYDSYILNDKDKFEYGSGCQYHVRGAGYHNYLLNNSKYKNKYQRINDGEKVKCYHTTNNKINDSFAYMQGNFPKEFAPEIDYEMQFEKTVLDPLNRVLKVIGLHPLDNNLFYAQSLF